MKRKPSLPSVARKPETHIIRKGDRKDTPSLTRICAVLGCHDPATHRLVMKTEAVSAPAFYYYCPLHAPADSEEEV
ncbi:MAG: hypothetical protein WC763_07315 [Candidatus Paceibacterota bacterium]